MRHAVGIGNVKSSRVFLPTPQSIGNTAASHRTYPVSYTGIEPEIEAGGAGGGGATKDYSRYSPVIDRPLTASRLRQWWAPLVGHFKYTRINIEPTIRRKEIADWRIVRAFALIGGVSVLGRGSWGRRLESKHWRLLEDDLSRAHNVINVARSLTP
jgi:hypothetical protein